MREILFRGKRTDSGEWVYGNYCIAEKLDKSGVEYFIIEIEAEGSQYYVIPETVGQYTGLTDKNGKKIFEGDIVNVAYNPKYTGISKDRIGNFEVVFNNGCFMKGSIQNNGLYHFIPSDETTVIGNIHDNPELLKGE